MKLFHISEHGNIDRFIPRKSKKMWGYKEYVWAISEKMLHNYLFPRGCPRICVGNEVAASLSEWIAEEDARDKKALIFISENWLEKLLACVLYRYEFDDRHFKLIDSIAGYYVSEFTEIPIEVKEIKNCRELLESMKVALIIKSKPELIAIKDRVIQATDFFSIIKWSNL